jgi:LysM repeat protein
MGEVSSSRGPTFKTNAEQNPSVASSCSLIEGNSYCMEQNYGVPVETTTTTTARTTTTGSSTTSAGNGITTPTPTQEGMVKNCNKFHLVAEGEGCSVIGQKYGVSLAQLYAWNPAIGSTCNNIWLNTYVCVGVVGGTGTTTTSTTTTSAGNGITTPTPTQEGMVKNCNKFHLVSEGEGCTVIGQKYGVSLAQMYAWNPAIGSTCNNIWLNTYVCVGVIGGTTTTTKATTTSAGNGITTPTPTQEGMVKNCNKFHLVSEGEGCASIGSKYGVSISSLVSWNPAIGSTCTNVWLNTYLCVGVIGGGGGTTFTTRTTTTTAGNGIATPTPTQPGMVSNCDRFHFVAENEGCATIATKYGIPLATFYSWNTGVGNNCQSLWGNTYVCVRTIGYVPPTTTTSRGVSALARALPL